MSDDVEITHVPSEVGLIKCWGSDYEAARAALVLGPSEVLDIDRGEDLIDDLSHSGHWGCMEHSGATLFVRVPIFTARQIIRTRTASYNEYSLRYRQMLPRFYIPQDFFTDVKRSKLGDAPEVSPASGWAGAAAADGYRAAWALYQSLVSKGIRKEQARIVLPLGAFTEFWMTANLRNWLHFLNLRLDAHAQFEMRDMAVKAHALIMAHFPITLSLWERYGRGPIDAGPIQTA